MMVERPVIALTGASGYVGSIIAAALAPVADIVRLGRSGADIAWSFDSDPAAIGAALRGRAVTHLIHAAWDMKASSFAEQQRSSVAGSKALLDVAVAAGVKHFIFISTISAFVGAQSSYGRAKLLVEQAFLDAGGTVLRLGLVHGGGAGGMFGTLRQAVAKGRFVPMIGRGREPQYTLDAETLGVVIRRAIAGELEKTGRPITLARPDPISFRDLLLAIAADSGQRVTPVALPWPLLYAALRAAEAVGLRPGVRSDSVISFVYQDPTPDFGPMHANGIMPCEPDFAE